VTTLNVHAKKYILRGLLTFGQREGFIEVFELINGLPE
jgi:hypothetical protein